MTRPTLPHTVAPLPPIGAPRYTPIPDIVLDDWILRLPRRSEVVVLLALLRATLGWAEPEVTLTRRQLARRTANCYRLVIEDDPRPGPPPPARTLTMDL